MHSVLDLKSDRSDSKTNKSLKQRLVKASLSGFLAHDYRPELAMVSNKNDVLSFLQNRKEGFWLCCLSSFIDKYLLEIEGFEALVESCDTSRTDDFCFLKDFSLRLSFEVLQLVFIFLT